MSAEVMLAFLNNCSLEAEIGFRVAFHCAPVLKNVKVSNVMAVKKGTWGKVWKALRNSPVRCIPLYADNEKELLLFYRQERLEEHLKKKENREFLNSFGYLDVSVAGVIRRLKRRYEEYAVHGQEFPHELGIVLEYPVKDVEGFIKHRGQNCLMERYWKVYHNLEQAKATFARYDQAKEQAMEEIIAGYPLYQVAVS